MTEREKVIKEFEAGIKDFSPADTSDERFKEVCEAALALLKAQEPVKPGLKKIRLGIHTDAVHIKPCCGGCGHKLEAWYKYCPVCGKAVKWDA